MDPDHEPVDEGLASERTDLAWNRTGLAVVVCLAVILRRLWPLEGADKVAALGCISAGAVAWAAVLWMGRAVSVRPGSDPRLMSPHRAAAITVGTLALALAAFALGLFPPT